MLWNYEKPQGTEVDPGWLPLVNETHLWLKERYPNYRIVQIKEKFGTLRYYAEGVDMEGQQYIAEQENKSAEICEECGEPGALNKERGWWKTQCPEHWGARKNWLEEVE